jgi:cysteine desulfurase
MEMSSKSIPLDVNGGKSKKTSTTKSKNVLQTTKGAKTTKKPTTTKSAARAKEPTKTKANSCSSVVYLDNNGTTLISKQAAKAYEDWIRCYNASADSKLSAPAKKLLTTAQDEILAHCGVSTASHTVLFTSGGTESNCYIIRACVKAYKRKLAEKGSDRRPHIIISAVEHHSIIECVKDLYESGDADISYITPTIYGNILPADVEKEIRDTTCLISIMYANNEIPIINNIREIGAIAHQHKVPMHSDCVQIFGKYKINILNDNIDALSAAAHKFYGPKGVGILILNNDLIEGYGLTAEINGSQQYGLRGGTENIPGIASTVVALKTAFVSRKTKNAKLLKLRQYTLEKLRKYFTFNQFVNYVYDDINILGNENHSIDKEEVVSDVDEKNVKADLELVSLGPPEDKYAFLLPNTILLAICKNRGKPFCNVELKKYLDSKGIVISIGSACMTSSDKASHVLSAIGAPPVVKRGVIRISFGDENTNGDVDKLVDGLINGIKKQCADIEKDYK